MRGLASDGCAWRAIARAIPVQCAFVNDGATTRKAVNPGVKLVNHPDAPLAETNPAMDPQGWLAELKI